MKQYLDLMEKVLNEGTNRGDRTGTGTVSLFGEKVIFDLRDGFPMVTTKRLSIKDVARELIWFLNGETNIKDLHPCKIWDDWSIESGETHAPYGWMWRYWPTEGRKNYIDQIAVLVKGLKENPNSRRHIVSAWNPEYMPDESISPQENVKKGKHALPPCHLMFQCYVDDGYLDMQLYIRSNDLALGFPYNAASYSLLIHALCNECGLKPGKLHYVMGDAHIYNNHKEGVLEQIKRTPFKLPQLSLKDNKGLDFSLEDIVIRDYAHHDKISYEISV